MDLFSLIGIGIIGAMLAVLLKQYKPEYAMVVSLVVGVLIFLLALESLSPIWEQIQTLLEHANAPSIYVEILLKSLGICFLTQIACDTCKDAGQGAIASKLEIAGKLAILLLSLPLFEELLSIVATLLSAGG